MPDQLDFSSESDIGEAEKDQHEANHAADLRRARFIAEALAQVRGEITIEDVREYMERHGGLPPAYRRAWLGAVFRGKEWERVGSRYAHHEGSHGRRVSVWRLVA